MVRLFYTTVFALSAGLALGCAKGRTPPPVSDMVQVPSKDGEVVFTFGDVEMCRDGEIKDWCSADRPPEVLPPMTVKLPAFAIDAHEVTNLQYQHCEALGQCSTPKGSNAGNVQAYYDAESSKFAEHPVVRVTWEQAKAYCEFAGKRLPTEFEWEAALRSGNLDKPGYPWGELLSDCSGNVAIKTCAGAKAAEPRAVTSMAQDIIVINGQQLHGMAGNVAEWTSTEYKSRVTCKDEFATLGDGCKGAYEVCGDTDDDKIFEKCAADYRAGCDACPLARPDDRDSSCWGQCLEPTPAVGDEGTTRALWVCARYPDAVAPPNTVGVTFTYRGSHYKDERDLCEVRPHVRENRHQDGNDPKDWLGFRCARTL